MPFIVPLLPALITAAVSGVGMGMQAAGVGQPSQTAALNAQQDQFKAQQAQQQATQDAQTRTSAVEAAKQYSPNIQSQLGGSVSPDYYAQTTATQTGYGDQLGAVRQALNMQGLAPAGGGQFNLSGNPGPAGGLPTGAQFMNSPLPDFLSQFAQGNSGFHGGQ